MGKFGSFQIIGAAITTIGIMFLIMNGLFYLNVFPMAGAGLNMIVVSLLMATNGYMIMLYGISNHSATAVLSALN